MIKIIPFAVPVFIALIFVELGVAWLQGRRDYLRFSDAVTALSCGIGNQVIKIFFFGVSIAAYAAVYSLVEPWHVWTPWAGFGVLAWIVAIFALDHQYYWWHRHSHRVNFMWAAHVVHHQSQEYNLAVALRQALFTSLTTIPYYLNLAVLGIHPMVFALVAVSNTLYQFWIHTRTVGRLGPLEWVLNTPSHHRVHHGINPEYIDKNHAGMFIIWDRLYGTFVQEREEPVYGTVMPLQSYDPIWANFAHWQYLAHTAWHAQKWSDKLKIWFMPPEWTPQGPKTIPPVDNRTFRKWDVPVARGLTPYLLVHFTLIVGATVWLLWMEGEIGVAWLALLGLSIFWATWSFARLFHRGTIGIVAESARLIALPPTLAILLLGQPAFWPAVVGGSLLCIASLVWVFVHRSAWTDVSDLDATTGVRLLEPTGPRGRRVTVPVAAPAPGK